MSVIRRACASPASVSAARSTIGIGTWSESRSCSQDAAAPDLSSASFSTSTPPTSMSRAISACGTGPPHSTNSTCSLSHTSTARHAATGSNWTCRTVAQAAGWPTGSRRCHPASTPRWAPRPVAVRRPPPVRAAKAGSRRARSPPGTTAAPAQLAHPSDQPRLTEPPADPPLHLKYVFVARERGSVTQQAIRQPQLTHGRCRRFAVDTPRPAGRPRLFGTRQFTTPNAPLVSRV